MAYDAGNDAELDALVRTLRPLTPQEILAAAIERFDGRIALVSSFGAQSVVLLHMVAEVRPNIPILFLDTGQLFGQTLDYRRVVAARLGLTDVRDLRPAYGDLAVEDPAANLYASEPDACCRVRKVTPLERGLAGGFDAWITGRKRFQTATRAHLAPAERDHLGRIKINPLTNWSQEDLDSYAAAHNLPPHPLTAFGYPSIGCWPCTAPVAQGADSRSGRWPGSTKTECGLHTALGRGGASGDVGGGI